MKMFLSFVLGFISYMVLLEYLEYKDYKNWNVATFKYREYILGDNTISKRQKIIQDKIETKYDRLLSILVKRPNLGKKCLFIFANKECPIEFLKFNPDNLKYNVYCWNKIKREDELLLENENLSKADEIFIRESNKGKNCALQIQNEEEL